MPSYTERYAAFREKILVAAAHAMLYGGVEGEAAEHRIREVTEWLNELRTEGALDAWLTNLHHPFFTAEALGRSERLLQEHLSDEQANELKELDYFHVRSSGKTFRIQGGHPVRELDENGTVVRTACAMPEGHLPTADTMLAQKLLLESRPDLFLAVANVHEVGSNDETIDRSLVEAILPTVLEEQRALKREQRQIQVEDFRRRIREALNEGERRYQREREAGCMLVATERPDGTIEVAPDSQPSV